mgnify:CR=1 FL=1
MRPSAPAAWFALILTLTCWTPGRAQSAEDPAHAELRTMRAALLDAITAQDIDKVLPLLHPDVVVTWQNGAVNRGHAGVRSFFEAMGRQSFGGYKVPPEPDELTILHGGTTGVSFGRDQRKLFGVVTERASMPRLMLPPARLEIERIGRRVGAVRRLGAKHDRLEQAEAGRG